MHLIGPVVFVYSLQFGVHCGDHDAGHFGCIISMFLVRGNFLGSSSFGVDIDKLGLENILFVLIPQSHLDVSNPVIVVCPVQLNLGTQ